MTDVNSAEVLLNFRNINKSIVCTYSKKALLVVSSATQYL